MYRIREWWAGDDPSTLESSPPAGDCGCDVEAPPASEPARGAPASEFARPTLAYDRSESQPNGQRQGLRNILASRARNWLGGANVEPGTPVELARRPHTEDSFRLARAVRMRVFTREEEDEGFDWNTFWQRRRRGSGSRRRRGKDADRPRSSRRVAATPRRCVDHPQDRKRSRRSKMAPDTVQFVIVFLSCIYSYCIARVVARKSNRRETTRRDDLRRRRGPRRETTLPRRHGDDGRPPAGITVPRSGSNSRGRSSSPSARYTCPSSSRLSRWGRLQGCQINGTRESYRRRRGSSCPRSFCRADIPQTGRGGAAGPTWIFRGDGSRRRRRGPDVDIPQTGRGGAAGAT